MKVKNIVECNNVIVWCSFGVRQENKVVWVIFDNDMVILFIFEYAMDIVRLPSCVMGVLRTPKLLMTINGSDIVYYVGVCII